MMSETGSGLRVDRWLWFTRFYKTRTMAAKAVGGGHVRINGERARPGARVTPGDRIELVRDRLPFQVDVVSIPSRRGPAVEAQGCYSESDESLERRQALRAGLQSDRQQMPRTDGRPDKHTRRKLRQRNRGL